MLLRARLSAALLGILLGTACTPAGSSEEGVGAPQGDDVLDEVLDHLPLEEAIGEDVLAGEVAARPDGGWVALLRSSTGQGPDLLADLTARDGGIEVGEVRELPALTASLTQVFVAADGTVIVSNARAEGASTVELLVLEPGADAVEARPLDPPVTDVVPTFPAALSADDRTLYLSLGRVDEAEELVAVEVATGAVVGTTRLPVGTEVYRLEQGPADGVTALATTADEVPQLISFGADLRPLGDPVPLLDPGQTGRPWGARFPDEDRAVVLVDVGDAPRVVTVEAGAVTAAHDLGPETASAEFLVDEAGESLTVPYADDGVALGTFDVATGGRTASVPLCGGATIPSYLSLDPSTGLVLVLAPCEEDGFADAFLVG